MNNPHLSGQIAKWILLLQEFNFVVNISLGKLHSNEDFLLHLNDDINPKSINESFFDAHITDVKDGIDVVDVISPKYADDIHY